MSDPLFDIGYPILLIYAVYHIYVSSALKVMFADLIVKIYIGTLIIPKFRRYYVAEDGVGGGR